MGFQRVYLLCYSLFYQILLLSTTLKVMAKMKQNLKVR